MFSNFLKLLCLFITALVLVSALNVEEIVETCPGNFITQDFNASWDNYAHPPDTRLYVPLADKYSIYVLTQYLYQSPEFKILTESQLEHSCIAGTMKHGWQLSNLTGYDKSILIGMQPTQVPKLFRFNLPIANGAGGFITGTSSIALTDNQSYVVFDFCYDNGLRSFAVVSKTSYLDDISFAVIKAHLKAIGFKEKNFVYLNYQKCFDISGDAIPYSGDVPIPVPFSAPAPVSISLFGNNNLYRSIVFTK